jgi:tetratricopeptide (TPR) repeat protein
MSDRTSYKTTLFDREGPDAAIKLKAWSYAAIAGSVSFGAMAYMGAQMALGPIPYVALILVVPAVMTVLVAKMALRAMDAVHAGVEAVIAPNTTPYIEQYSYQQALVMQGRLDEALESYEAIIAEPKSKIDVRIRAAELYTREAKRHDRAAELLQEVLRHPECTVGEEVYAANRLSDLLSGPLKQPAKALVPLRRLADRYPNTPAGERAREAIRTLKALTHPPA